MADQLPTTEIVPRAKLIYGRLHKTINSDPKASAKQTYNRVLVKSEKGQFETLLLTDGELDRIRARSAKNPEEDLVPTWTDKLRAL
tara:strand:+ start:251 stop:508 length:258 start_codon:yes stop_codon:yes gene_type:complete